MIFELVMSLSTFVIGFIVLSIIMAGIGDLILKWQEKRSHVAPTTHEQSKTFINQDYSIKIKVN